MDAYQLIPADGGGDFALRVLDDSLLPYIKPGGIALVRRRTDLRDGEVGLFRSQRGMVFRQFCRDSQGNIYLFPVNRRYRDLDLTILRRRAGGLVCYGKLVLERSIPLPMD